MKAYHIDRFGSVGGIARRSSQDPRPGLKEVLMRVRASSRGIGIRLRATGENSLQQSHAGSRFQANRNSSVARSRTRNAHIIN